MSTLLNTQPLKKVPIRIESLDLARGLAVLFMVLIHVLDFYGHPDVHHTFFGTIIQWLGCYPAAPVFMFIMGIFIASSTQSLTAGLKRAAWLFALGYILNIIRLVIPMWIVASTGISSAPELAYHTPLIEFFIGDILQFAGLAFACCVLLKHYFPSIKVLLVIILAIIFLSPYVWDISRDLPIADQLLKLLWGHKYAGSMFPLFPWLAYPLSGVIFGYKIATAKSLKKLFNQTLALGIAIAVSGFLLTSSNPEWHIGYFLRGGPGATITNIGVVLIWLWCCHFLVEKVANNRVFSLLYFWSRNVTTLYMLQWIFIGWGLIAFGFNQLGLTGTLLMMLSVLVASDVGTRIWLKITKKKPANKVTTDIDNETPASAEK